MTTPSVSCHACPPLSLVLCPGPLLRSLSLMVSLSLALIPPHARSSTRIILPPSCLPDAFLLIPPSPPLAVLSGSCVLGHSLRWSLCALNRCCPSLSSTRASLHGFCSQDGRLPIAAFERGDGVRAREEDRHRPRCLLQSETRASQPSTGQPANASGPRVVRAPV